MGPQRGEEEAGRGRGLTGRATGAAGASGADVNGQGPGAGGLSRRATGPGGGRPLGRPARPALVDAAPAGDDDLAVAYDAEEIAAVFGRAAPGYDTVIPFFARFGTRLVDLADVRPGERVLDVGAGLGATLLPAAERAAPDGSVLGVDLSERMVDALALDLQRRGVANASVQRMNAEALAVEPASFDVVLCSFVLHLVPDPDRAARGFLRALRPGGRCAASVPRGAGPAFEFLARLFRAFAPRARRPVPMPFRPDFDLGAVLASAGFEVVQDVGDEIEFRFPGGEAWWDWAWSHGLRALFETLEPDDLEELRGEALTELGARTTADGLSMPQQVNLVVARNPGTVEGRRRQRGRPVGLASGDG